MADKLFELLKEVAVKANSSTSPCNWLFGTVTSVGPLKIKINNLITIDEPFLVLSHLVKDHYVDMTVSMQTENDKFLIKDHTHPYEDTQPNGQPVIKNTQTTPDLDVTHKHEIKHTIKVLQHYGLKVGEKVMLIQKAGAKTYYVLDRIEPPICSGEWL